MRFSERLGFKPVKSVLQLKDVDDDLRNGLWSVLVLFYWNRVEHLPYGEPHYDSNTKLLVDLLWIHYFKRPLDTIPDDWHGLYTQIRDYFYKGQWFEVYDFIEFVHSVQPEGWEYKRQFDYEAFASTCNRVLERELSGYRLVSGVITPISSTEELKEIEEAIGQGGAMKGVTTHLRTALERLSDRKAPDYRNSIKESISAVEAVCKIIAKNPKAELGQALKEIEKQGKVTLHGALKGGFEKLYGYTSDAQGIRHALLDEPSLDFEDAKFMLVACSAFVNYLKGKAAKTGMKLS